jgi:serine protease Do
MAKSVAVSETPASTVAAQHGRVPAEIAAPPSFANLVEGVSPAVVTIEVDRQEKMQAPDAMRDFPFGGMAQPRGNGRANPTPAPRSRAAGSGFIIDSDGYIVTNNHVVELARKITVHLADKRELDAKLVGTDVDTDVALLKVEARNLPTVKFGNDLRLRVGDWAVAVGNPFSLGGTVTAGIVSSMGRDIGNGPYTDYIQLDAPINQGNSGGPTFDISGQVIGMNTAIYSPSGGERRYWLCYSGNHHPDRRRPTKNPRKRPAWLARRGDPQFHTRHCREPWRARRQRRIGCGGYVR